MAIRSVGFLLKTDGKAQVKNDFAEVRSAGAEAMGAIADAAEDTARRSAVANDEYSKRQIESWNRQANAAKLNAARTDVRAKFDQALATPGSQQFSTVNLDRSTGAARESAGVFQEVARAEEAAASSAIKLRAAIEPLWAAEQRLAAELADVALAEKAGILSADQLAEAQSRAKARFDESRLALDANASALARWRQEATEAKLATLSDGRRDDFDAAMARVGNGGRGAGQYATVDLDRSTGSARASAEVFEQQFRAQETAAAAAIKLRAAVDPLWAAEQRLAQELTEVTLAQKAEILTTEQLATAQAQARKRFDETTDAIKRQNGAGGGLSRNMKQTLIYTASDIVGSSANGIDPMQLLIQQGPQVAQALAMEEGGLLKLRALINTVTVGIGALAAATVVGAMAWLDHSNAMAKFNAVAQGSGRLIGLNGDALEANAVAAAAAGDMTVGAAREIELAYVQTGKITGGVLVGLTAMTKDFAAATGTDAKTAAATLGAAFADPIAGAEDLALKYGAVSQAAADYIAKLVEQGDMTGAQRVLLEALQPAFDGAADHANVLAQGWDNIKTAAAGAWEWMGKALDRMATGGSINDQIKALEAERDRPRSVGSLLFGNDPRADIQKKIDALRFEAQQEVARTDRAKANAARTAGQQVADRYTGADTLGSYQTAAGKLRAALKTDMPPEDRKVLVETLGAYTHAIDTFIPKQEKANQIAAIDAKIAATKSPAAKAALASEKARLEMSGQVIDRASAETIALSRGDRARAQATGTGDKHAQSLARQAASMEVSAAAALDVADAYLKSSAAGMVAEARRKASTDATRKGIDVEAQMRRQLNLQISDGVATTTKTIAALRDETAARTAVNDNVAAGTMTVAQMNQALSDESALRPLLAAATVAQAQGMTAAYDSIMRAVNAYRGALADAHAEEARSGAAEAISASRRTVADLRASILGMSGAPLDQAIAAARRAAGQEADDKRFKGKDRTDLIDTKVDEARATYAQRQAGFILDTLRNQSDSIELSERELQLAGTNDRVRGAELEKLQLALQIRRQFPDMAAADVAQILAGVDAQSAVNEKLKVTAAAIGEVRGYGNQFVDEVLNEDTWSSWGNAGQTVLASIKNEFIKLALLNPLKNLINGNSALPTITSALGNLRGLFGGSASVGAIASATSAIGSNATGTESWSGGLTYVNENGGEIIDLPNKTRIYPAAESRRMMQAANDAGARGSTTIIVNANDAVLAETVRGWVADGMAIAATQGAAGGAKISSMNMARRARRRLPGN